MTAVLEAPRDNPMNDLSTLYSQDYSAWAKQMADLLKAGQFSELDIAHLVEELEGMGASERNELENRFIILLAHLLKWQFQYRQLSERWQEFKGDSWRNTMIEQRTRLARRLRKSPGLKATLDEVIVEIYPDARGLASKETQLPINTFPAVCPYSQAQILSDDYYPPME
jgi:hypothetical protein